MRRSYFEAVSAVQSQGAGVPGKSVGAAWHRMPKLFGTEAFNAALERLHQSMPMLVPAVRLVPFASLDNLLEEEDVQVIFTFRDSAPPKADYREFFKCPVVCACSGAHLLAGKTVLTIKDLQNAGRMATCPRTVYPERFLQLQGHLMSGRRAEELFLCDQMEVVQTLVASGYAFAILPDIPGTHTEGLCYIPVENTPEFSYGAAYLKSSLTPSLRKFLKLLDELLNEKKNEKKAGEAIKRPKEYR